MGFLSDRPALDGFARRASAAGGFLPVAAEWRTMVMNGFTVCVLGWGPHVELMRRCLGSILCSADPRLVCSLRVGLNEVGPETRALVYKGLHTTTIPALVYDSSVNRFKYPLMRKMLHLASHPVVTPYVMWFDDDSFITDERPSWWSKIYGQMDAVDMLGAVYTVRATAKQMTGIKDQPWYAGVRMPADHRFRFATGGWWCCRTRLLQKWNYPWPILRHNGGDTGLGECVRQQRARLLNFHEGVAVNAGDGGKDSSAPRRGVCERPVWYDYDPTRPADLSHHDFELTPVKASSSGPLPAEPVKPATRSGMIKVPGL